ncbi:unnamed protein product [Phyllotreta striolata]|uniref:Uncharacterized protein n=1 Tax=Phyllotreta striolata TaxID=444603 RepID=A0A9N9TPU8_PHYSR|nr:unnamed protein product [Phyllotreta striolata]
MFDKNKETYMQATPDENKEEAHRKKYRGQGRGDLR